MPLFLLLATTAFGGPEASLTLQSQHLEHLGSLSPNTIIAKEKWNSRRLASLVKVTYGLQGSNELKSD